MVRKDAFNPRLRTDKLQVDLSTWRLLDQPVAEPQMIPFSMILREK